MASSSRENIQLGRRRRQKKETTLFNKVMTVLHLIAFIKSRWCTRVLAATDVDNAPTCRVVEIQFRPFNPVTRQGTPDGTTTNSSRNKNSKAKAEHVGVRKKIKFNSWMNQLVSHRCPPTDRLQQKKNGGKISKNPFILSRGFEWTFPLFWAKRILSKDLLNCCLRRGWNVLQVGAIRVGWGADGRHFFVSFNHLFGCCSCV